MYKIVWIAVRPNTNSPVFWETPEWLPQRQAIDEVIEENPGLLIGEGQGPIEGTNGLKYHRTAFFNTKEDNDLFRQKLEEKFPEVKMVATEYFQLHGHGLIMNIYSGDEGNLLVKKMVLNTVRAEEP